MGANQASFKTNEIQRVVLVRSKLRHKPLKRKSIYNTKAQGKHRNKYVGLSRKTKKVYCLNLHLKNTVDNQKAWITLKSL